MNLQEIIVILIVAGCIGWIILRFARSVTNIRNNGNPCANCATGCALQKEMSKKQQECREKQEKNKKNCCG